MKKDTSFLPHMACSHCNELVAYRDAVKKHTDADDLCFCDDTCATDYYKKENGYEVPRFDSVTTCCRPGEC